MKICETEEEYINAVAPAARSAVKKIGGYLPSVLIAQSCLENGFGKDPAAKVLVEVNNMVGLKSSLLNSSWSQYSVWPGKSVVKETPEYISGERIMIRDSFRVYDTPQQSFEDFLLFIRWASNDGASGTPKYGPEVMSIKDPGALIKAVRTRGYATDPTYDRSVMRIITRYGLTCYDTDEKEVKKVFHKIEPRPITDITKRNRSEVPAARGSHKIEYIVIHYLGVANADNPNLYGGGYGGHYNIKRDGSIHKAADPRTAVVWQCGGGLQGPGGHAYYKQCTNWNSIGIENGVCATVKNPSDDSDAWYFTTETQESLIYLVSKLMDEYGIPLKHVIRHYDVTGKICPNPYVRNNRTKTSWTWDEFKARLAEYRRSGGYTTGKAANALPAETISYYRVRADWADTQSQIGAYTVLDNAVAAAKQHPGTCVYDWNGKQVYPAEKQEQEVFQPFTVRVSITDLNIRTGAGTGYARVRYIPIGVYTIVEIKAGKGSKAGWGRLKSGAGWISLDYAQRISNESDSDE